MTHQAGLTSADPIRDSAHLLPDDAIYAVNACRHLGHACATLMRESGRRDTPPGQKCSRIGACERPGQSRNIGTPVLLSRPPTADPPSIAPVALSKRRIAIPVNEYDAPTLLVQLAPFPMRASEAWLPHVWLRRITETRLRPLDGEQSPDSLSNCFILRVASGLLLGQPRVQRYGLAHGS